MIGVDETAWYSGLSLPSDFSPWCSGYTHASGPVVLDPTDNNFCWKAPSNVEVGAICEKRIRALTLADFYPVEYESSCYLFSYERAFPHSDMYGEHNLADRWCGDVGAEVAVIASAKENEDVVGMASKDPFGLFDIVV